MATEPMTTEYVIYHVYKLDGITRRVPQMRLAGLPDANECFDEFVTQRPGRYYELTHEARTVLRKTDREPEAFRMMEVSAGHGVIVPAEREP